MPGEVPVTRCPHGYPHTHCDYCFPDKGMQHFFHRCDRENCVICEGGLSYCIICKEGEAGLADECPGENNA